MSRHRKSSVVGALLAATLASGASLTGTTPESRPDARYEPPGNRSSRRRKSKRAKARRAAKAARKRNR